jgi:hypothetical protein
MYDDGNLQIAIKYEIKGSQGRLFFYERNVGVSPITDLSIGIDDPLGLLRHQLAEAESSIAPGGNQERTLMYECVKPTAPGPNVTVRYKSNGMSRDVTLPLPVGVTSFNEPMVLTGPDFQNRWQSLKEADQEAQEVFATSLDFNTLQTSIRSILRFGTVVERIDASETVVNGVASLRTGALNQANEKINVGSLVKAELSQGNLRVTVRTIYPAASKAVLATIKDIFVSPL